MADLMPGDEQRRSADTAFEIMRMFLVTVQESVTRVENSVLSLTTKVDSALNLQSGYAERFATHTRDIGDLKEQFRAFATSRERSAWAILFEVGKLVGVAVIGYIVARLQQP